MKAMNDQEMVIRAQQGDLEAEESLMRKYKEIVKRSQLCDLRWSLHNQTDHKRYSYGRPGKA